MFSIGFLLLQTSRLSYCKMWSAVFVRSASLKRCKGKGAEPSGDVLLFDQIYQILLRKTKCSLLLQVGRWRLPASRLSRQCRKAEGRRTVKR